MVEADRNINHAHSAADFNCYQGVEKEFSTIPALRSAFEQLRDVRYQPPCGNIEKSTRQGSSRYAGEVRRMFQDV